MVLVVVCRAKGNTDGFGGSMQGDTDGYSGFLSDIPDRYTNYRRLGRATGRIGTAYT